ncbi:MAG TPA: VacJ family lipoprotein [Aliidongia sp.]|nr:VacJ family lipoprotein [Aliidongia sp.]
MLSRRFRSALPAALALCAASLAACASQPSTPKGDAASSADATNNDPLESVNRGIWDFDLALKDYLLTPIAKGYRWATPQFVQTGISNVLRNLRSPTILMNDVLQGNMDRAGDTFARIWLNTIIGVGGIFDVGTSANVPFHDTDFGATLGSWGVPAGPYLVLPLIGPSDPRDGVGYGVDSLADPFTIKMRAANMDEGNYVRFGVSVVNEEAQTLDEFNELRRSSLDFYAAVRSLYQQKRAADVQKAKSPDAPAAPSVPYDEVDTPANNPPPAH